MLYIFALVVLGYVQYRIIRNKLRRFFMKIRYYIVYLLLTVMMIVATGITVFLMFRAYSVSVNPGMKYLDFHDIEKDLGFDPVFDANNGFVVNPYQTGNPDRNQAAIMEAFASYIMKEVKLFTMFAVVLAVLVLFAYIIVAFIVFNSIIHKNGKIEIRN
jgi:hypothetical protein